MAGKMVSCDTADTVRIVVPGGVCAVLPVSVILDMGVVLRACQEDETELEVVFGQGSGLWEASTANSVGQGDTPWGALVALARALEEDGRG